MDIFLDRIVHPVHHLEAAIEDLKDRRCKQDQRTCQHRQNIQIDSCQSGADLQRGDHGKHQHHGAADGHTDHHLEGHLQIGNIRGQTGNDGCGREFVNVAEAELLHIVKHIVPQIFGKAGTGFGCENGRGHAEAKGGQSAEYQQNGFADNDLHILLHNTVVIQVSHDQRDQHFHGNFAHHTQRAEKCGPFVFPDAPGQSSYHSFVSSLCLRWQGLPPMLMMARCSSWANWSCSSGVKPSTMRFSLLRMVWCISSWQASPLGRT